MNMFEEIEKEDASLSQRLAYNQENQQIKVRKGEM